jgi:cell division protein FtsB
VFFAFRGYTHHRRLSAMRQNVLSQIKDETKVNRRLNTQMLLFQDKNFLEYMGRKHLLMVKPNEVLYRFAFEKPVKK